MPDVFISYSRKDSDRALALAERLTGEGMSVWIDQRGIEAAKSWSKEIVEAIEASKAFVLLLSSNSIESTNVVRELSIAFESNRTLIPVALEDVILPTSFKYQLAGIQRVAYTQHDAITQALIGCGITIAKAAKKKDDRKSLLVMPFEDLSPTQDNLWFADGLAGELIDKLSHIKSLRLVDRKTSRDLRHTKLSMYEIAEALEVQYVIEGSVRKFGDQIKISTSLLDVKEGEYLWQESHKGVMADIFDLQENVAEKAAAALKVHFEPEAEANPSKRMTSDALAYELYLRGIELYNSHTLSNRMHAIDLLAAAVKLDPNFIQALTALALSHISCYVDHHRPASHIDDAGAIVERIREIEGESARYFRLSAFIHYSRREYEQAVALARKAIEINPKYVVAYEPLAFALGAMGNIAAEAETRAKLVELMPENVSCQFNYLLALHRLKDRERLRVAARAALPFYDSHLRLRSNDTYGQLCRAVTLLFAGREEDARLEAERLTGNIDDARNTAFLAALFCDLQDNDKAMQLLVKAAQGGFADVWWISEDPELEPLRLLPEFQEIVEMVKQNASGESKA